MKQEYSEQKQEFEKWDVLAKRGLDENRELLRAVALKRSEQCTEFMGLIDKHLEVLSVTVTRAIVQGEGTKAAST